MKKTKSNSQLVEVLEKHSLRKTPIRADVLDLFFNKPYALTHSDLEDALNKKYDRVTIYRTLHTFEEKGLIHKVPDETGMQKFALCHTDCSAEKHFDEHIHFLCSVCGNTYCLDVKVPLIKLPEGYSAEEFRFTVRGTCKDCI